MVVYQERQICSCTHNILLPQSELIAEQNKAKSKKVRSTSLTKINLESTGLAIIISVLAVTSACGRFGPPEECPFTGSANEPVFAQHFSRMAIVTKGAALPKTRGDSGLTFSSNDRLELVVISLAGT